MMTSRAEYRLLLRQDNADLRLTALSHGILIDDSRNARLEEKRRLITEEIKRIERVNIAPTADVNEVLESRASTPISNGMKLAELIKRPELDYFALAAVDTARPALPQAVQEQVNIEVKYEGYISRQLQQIAQFKKMEGRKLPSDIDYEQIQNMRLEARQKLAALRPANLGQASRISGVSPADLTSLMIYIERGRANERN